ncbi:acyl-CoA thioesterase [Paractinoplanes atraurantiacus]|uniref:Acyl-CoA thioester hydrolase n=1 Tax=Paractinoplanes atraurantiacus TaxID=1036182 RepID=A0A285K4N4_9ACTN|nr:thioesterase family protein [Actinoplanes atraurantiacus]SNY67542.1 acyl-CoA thioester hydrolase [Actinoplanes atraurantiacus]
MTTLTETYGGVVRLPVHFDDLDAMGVLHNSRYAVLVERALLIWWQERGVFFSKDRPPTPDTFNVVREYAITYHRPVAGAGEVVVRFWLDRLGTTSAEYGFEITSSDGGTVHAEGRRVNVGLDARTMRPAPWTDHAREVAAELLKR